MRDDLAIRIIVIVVKECYESFKKNLNVFM